MKKNILLVLLCCFLVIGLTGCGNKKEVNKDNNQSAQVEDDKNDGIAIKEVVAPFSNGVAFVKDSNNNVYAIDEKGNVKFNLDESIDKCQFFNGYTIIDKKSVLDPNGNKILEEQKGTFYYAVSESGYISKKSSESSLAGDTTKFSIVDTTGKEIKANEERNYEYVAGDIYKYGETLVNVKTGKEFKPERGGEISGGITNKTFYLTEIGERYVMNENLETYYSIPSGTWDNFDVQALLNDKYFAALDGKDSNKKYGIYDMSGNLVKDLTEGGIENIFYINGVYYVYSNTGYLYTLDESFNYIKEPFENPYSNVFLPTTEGLLAFKEDKVYLLDKNLSKDELTYITNVSWKDADRNIMSLKQENNGFKSYTNDKYLYVEDGRIYDLKAEKMLEIYK